MQSVMKIADARHMASLDTIKNHRVADSYHKFTLDPSSNSGLESVADRAIQAGILNNMAKVIDSAEAQSVILSKNYGPYVPEIWPVITAWYPEFPLKDLISVQDMEKPLAYLFFSRLKTGTNKGRTLVGDVVETPTGSRTIRGNYPTGEVTGENIPVAQWEAGETPETITSITAYAPIVTKNVPSINALGKILVKTYLNNEVQKVFVAHQLVGNTIELKEKGASAATKNATIDVQSGLITLPGTVSTISNVEINYVWDIETSTEENLPKVVEDIEMIPLEAQPRALGMQWTLFSEFIKKSQFGTDIREETTKRVLDLLYQYQVRYILDTLYDYAEGDGAEHNIQVALGSGYDLHVVAQSLNAQLKDIASIVEINSGRIEGNRIVCGRTLKNFLESLQKDIFTPAEQQDAFSGPRKIGTFGTFEVYFDPERGDHEGFVTYRGKEWYDAVFYLGTFMPIVPSDIISLGVRVREAFVSMEAYYYHKPTCVIPFTFNISQGK